MENDHALQQEWQIKMYGGSSKYCAGGVEVISRGQKAAYEGANFTLYVRTHVHTYVCTYVYTLCITKYIHTYAHTVLYIMYVHTCILMYIRTYMHMPVCYSLPVKWHYMLLWKHTDL